MINFLDKWKFIIFCIIFIIVLWLLIGHRDHLISLRNYVDQLKQDTAKQNATHKVSDIKLPTAVTYNAGSLLSPFGETTTNTSQTATKEQIANPLLAYSLSVLRFVGTLSEGDAKYAFIVAPDNVVYQIGIGDSIGLREGKVVDIQPQRLDVMEKTSENGISTQEHLVTLELKEGH